jgi:hypothetical protein
MDAERKGFGIYDDQYLRRDGGNFMEGPLQLAGDPTLDNQAGNKAYIDRQRTAAEAQAQTLVTQLQALLQSGLLDPIYLNRVEMPGLYQRDIDDPWTTVGVAAAADRFTLRSPGGLSLDIDGNVYFIRNAYDIPLNNPNAWDALVPDYTVAANRAGVDFYIYACQPPAGTGPLIVLSDNAAVPAGYTAANSRRIGGFHGLCVAVGAIGGHPLTNFVAGDILPASVWDEIHRPICEPEGMVFSEGANVWVDVYLPSGVGAATASVFGAVISDNRVWLDFVDDGGAVRKRLLWDPEFQMIAFGSNEETNIAGGADPVTTGGHSDTAARRMISNIGCEDCCGAINQFLGDQAYSLSSTSHNHTNTIIHKGAATGSVVNKDQLETQLNGVLGSAANEDITGNNTNPTPGFAWQNLSPGRGGLNRQGTAGDVKITAGGLWNSGLNAGSQCRNLTGGRDATGASISARFCCNPR